MKYLLLLSFLINLTVFGQEIKRENTTKEIRFYYDFEQKKVASKGCYYKDLLGETTEKHGVWLYYDKDGNLVEKRAYYREKLNGPVLSYFANGKLHKEGYFKNDLQDSIYREWFENGTLAISGNYTKNKPVGQWQYNYVTGKTKLIEEVKDSINYIMAFWLPDSLHTQTVSEGNGALYTFFNTGADKEWYNYKNGLKNGPFEEYSIYGYKLIAGKFTNGEKDSTWTYWYYTGDLEKISNYKNGVLQGKYQYYFDKNRLNVEGYYEAGKKSGIWTWYANNGKKDMEGTFKNDLQDGKWTYWYPTGEVSYYANYEADKKTGTWTYYYKNGTMFKQGTFENDLKNGIWETWYEDETLLMSGVYKNGKEEGLWKNYWENGKLKNETTFKKGLLNGLWKSYYPSGKLKATGNYEDGLKTGEWTELFENGKPKDVGSYKIITVKSKIEYGPLKDMESTESVKHGEWISFSQKDYKRTEQGTYKNGEKDGEWIAYYPGGKIPNNITHFKDGKLNGLMAEYDRKGALISECFYKNGLRDGTFRMYDKNGKVIVEKEFKEGQQVIIGGNQQFNPR
jgi:antitoxin component YwqK of YwqJK toxin-antitoxin module